MRTIRADDKVYVAAIDVAVAVDRHASTVYAWCHSGKVASTRFGGGGGKSPGLYIELESLRAYLGVAASMLGDVR
jgi:hypothetical protein